MYRYVKTRLSLEDVDKAAHNIFNDVMRIVDYKAAQEHKIDKEIRELVSKEVPDISDYDIYRIIDRVYENIDNHFSFTFGKSMADKYGDLVYKNFEGEYISKAIAEADKPGGLRYSANQIGLSTFQLLETLEGMCADGTVTCVDDSTYFVGEA